MGEDVAAVVIAEPIGRTRSPPRLSSGPRWLVTETILGSMTHALRESRLVARTSLASRNVKVGRIANSLGIPFFTLPEADSLTAPPPVVEFLDGAIGLLVLGLMPLLQAQEVAFLLGRVSSGRTIIAPAPNDPSHGVVVVPADATEGTLPMALQALTGGTESASGPSWETHWLEGTLVVGDTHDLPRVQSSSRTSTTREVLRGLGIRAPGHSRS